MSGGGNILLIRLDFPKDTFKTYFWQCNTLFCSIILSRLFYLFKFKHAFSFNGCF